MDIHLDRKIVFRDNQEFRSLHEWSLIEKSDDEISTDEYIPWHWSQYFRAKEAKFSDRILSRNPSLDAPSEGNPVEQSQSIVVDLEPNAHRFANATTYSMLGTARTISKFSLCIRPLSNSSQPEFCHAYGAVSYDLEIDFRKTRIEDFVEFELWIKPEAFWRYADRISRETISEIEFKVGFVSGFYSTWSPSISTDHIKVLTEDKYHAVEFPDGRSVNLPRMGIVGDFDLAMDKRISLST